MSISFTESPYYDDFDPSKNFHRILFKPGFAVQSRELTQMQTILQSQISNFADNIFVKNTPVSGGKVTTNLNCSYIKLNTTFNGITISAQDFLNKTITDSTGTILAKVIATAEATGTQAAAGDPPTLIVTYFSGQQFTDATQIFPIDGSNFTASTIGTSGGTTSTGPSSVASISDGVFYVRNGYYTSSTQNQDGTFSKFAIGNFVSVQPQTVILNKYNNTPSFRVGLTINETVADYIQDASLLDPAIGASNYQAPGADRYQIVLQLTALSLSLGNDDAFIELVRLQNGVIVKQVDGTVYSTIDDYFAKRTYDTNGDFVVNDFSITPVANTTNSTQYDLKIGKGVAYVRGYRAENQSDIVLTNNRSRTTQSQNNNSVFVDYGSYFYVDKVRGAFDVTTGQPVDLHIVPAGNVVTTNTTTYNSSLIGKGYIRNLNYDHNTTDSDTLSYVYRAYVYDITTNTLTGNVSTATSQTITFVDTNGHLSSSANAYGGVVLTIDSGTGIGYNGIITTYNASTKVANVTPAFTVVPDSTSKFSLKFATKDVEMIANTTSGSYTFSANAAINTTGKVNGIANSDTIYENPNTPELIQKIGYPYVASVTNGTYSSTQVFRNKTFSGVGTVTLSLDLPVSYQSQMDFAGGTGTLSADVIKQNFTVIVTSTSDTANNGVVGSVMDFCSSGNTVVISSDKNNVTFSSTKYKAPLSVTIIAKVNITNADATDHFLKTKTLISGNTSIVSYAGPSGTVNTNTLLDLTNGQVYIQNAGLVSVGQNQNLYVTDVKRIAKIIDTGSPSTVPTTNMLTNSSYDITSHYSFNNGQHDTHYGHAFLILNPGFPQPKGNILVILDYYSHSSADGYYTIASYINESYAQIPSYIAKNGTAYNLRDCIDFRPSRKNATANYVLETSNNPAASDSGYFIPQDLTNWLSNYSFYFGRKDKLVLTKDKNFQIIQGDASVNPIFPVQPEGSLLIANLTHDPYTAYLPSEAPKGTLPNLSVQKVSHKRWTMSDISDLQTRVNNIEYYTTLNLLEQNAQSLQVPDNNGLNRFKNGILVDDFSTYAVADTTNPDFSASIDRVTKQMSATQKINNYSLQSLNSLNTLGNASANASTQGYNVNQVNKTTNVFSLPYSNTAIITQQLASQTVNLNPFTTPVYQGVCYLNPPMDNWVDNTQEPDLLIVDPNLQVYQQSNTLNTLSVTNWQTVPGTQFTVVGAKTNTVGHNINPSPYGYRGYTSQTTQTLATQTQTVTSGYWSNLGSSYNNNNGYITDISIQPYIRPQQLIFKSKGLKINTPVSTFFDGINVDQYITNPDVMELTNVTGTFSEDDVIGYYDSTVNQFMPIATVVSVYQYTDTTKVRLYVTGNFHTSHKEFSVGEINSSTISNAFFDSNGNYVSRTAYGSVSNSTAITFNNSGYVGSVGGAYTDAASNNVTMFRSVISGYSSFLNVHGVWSTQNKTGNVNATYTVNFPVTGTYYFQGAADESGSFWLDGTRIINATTEGTAYLYSATVTAGNHTVKMIGTGGSPSDNQIALAISDQAWAAAGSTSTNGNIIFSSAHPLTVAPTGVGQVFGMTGGGAYYTGVTQIALSPSASNTDSYYVGTKIYITSTYVSQPVMGQTSQSTQSYAATITAYDGQSRIATLNTAVNISVGYNNLVGSMLTSMYSLSGLKTSYSLAIQQGGHPTLSTNENGDFVGIFNLPEGQFRTGERIFRVDNRTTDNDPASATTYAEATFTASGLSTKSQAIDFAASISSAKNTFVQTAQKNNVVIKTTTVTNPWDPVAQTFIIDKTSYPNGAFINSLRVFFRSKPTESNIPVTLSIVGTQNGYPNGETLDHSIVTLSSDKVNVSSAPHYLDSTTYTEFVFETPVYIQSGTLYAFILQSPSQDYNLFVAAQNATAISSSVKNLPTDPTPTTITKIGTAPYVGALFESQNSITWTADQTKSLMFVINRCVFDTSKNPKIRFVIPKALPGRKSTTQDIQAFYSPDLINNIQGTFTSQDVLSDAYNISTTDFVPASTGISYTYLPTIAASNSLDVETAVIPGKFGSPTFDNIYLNDGKGERILQAKNANSFTLYASLSSIDDTMSPIISDDGLSLYNINWNINNLGLSNNTISLTNGGSGYNTQTTYVTISSPDVSGGTQATASANIINGVIQSVYITSPGSGYLQAPQYVIADANNIPGTGATVSGISEYSARGGNASTRYVTKKTTLSSGNDSQDLRVFFTAYRPVGTNIYVFYRIQNRNDSQTFENGAWQLMTYVNNTGNGYSASRTDVMEFEVAPGIGGVADDQVTYTSTTGTTYSSFNQFAIKIVLTTNDNTSVPYLTDVRTLALPSGTGL